MFASQISQMELKGKIVQLLPLQSGESARGPWRKQEYIMEIPGQFSKKVCLYAWGDSIDQFDLKEGEEVTASIDIESREYNGRWYTNVKVWKIEREQPETTAPSGPSDPSSWPMPEDEAKNSSDDFDDLPF